MNNKKKERKNCIAQGRMVYHDNNSCSTVFSAIKITQSDSLTQRDSFVLQKSLKIALG